MLLLDEISMGLAPIIVGHLYELVAAIAASGVTVVVVEQFAETALGVADRAAIMLHGRVAHEGTPAEMADAAERLPLTVRIEPSSASTTRRRGPRPPRPPARPRRRRRRCRRGRPPRRRASPGGPSP